MSAPEPTGVDLARVALAAARAAAKGRPADRPARVKRRAAIRRTDGRDPLPLGKAIERMVTERGWEEPAAGGSVIDQWPQIAPELAGKVTAEAYDAETGRLSLRPATGAYAAQMRLFEQQMVARINERMGRTVVRSLRVLSPGHSADHSAPTPAPGDTDRPAAAPGQPGGPPIRTRDDASPGLLATQELLAELRAGKPKPQRPELPPPVLREPEEKFREAVILAEELAEQDARDADPHARALARARAEKAGRAPAVPTVFGRTA